MSSGQSSAGQGLPGATPGLPAVLFFDGECGLCNGLVRILIRLDRPGRLHYAPLQGPSAQAYLPDLCSGLVAAGSQGASAAN
jgi:hypothetical protein